MKSKQELLVDVLSQKLSTAKVGVIVRGVVMICTTATWILAKSLLV